MIDIPTGAVKFRINQTSMIAGTIEKEDNRLILYSGFNTYLKDEFKAMQGARWLGKGDEDITKVARKAWGVADSERNRFQLAYLLDMNPYAVYDKALTDFNPRRLMMYVHQRDMASHITTRRQCIIAGEMGVGKTLSAIEAMEQSRIIEDYWLWVGPRSALDSVKYEFHKWKVCQICGKLGKHHRYENHQLYDPKAIKPRFETYEGVKKMVETWPKGTPAYRGVVFDECSRLKTWTAQRTQAAAHLTTSMRNEHGEAAIICLMSGTPSPKDPSDWWSLAEIACPGFLREGSVEKFKRRLGLIKMYDGLGGGSFPKLVGWWDDEKKCAECMKFEDDLNHDPINMVEKWYHRFRASKNEVSALFNRLNGLVMVKLKSECLDLPEKIYKRVICKANASVLRAASLIAKTASSTIKALILLRELSDGFQYTRTESGVEKCPTCSGTRIVNHTVDIDDPNNPLDSESLTRGHRAIWDDTDSEVGYVLTGYKDEPLRTEIREIECYQCKGSGEVPHYITDALRVDCPKDEAFINILDQYEEEGRMCAWAGFTESVDRISELCVKHQWPIVRLDGRGWYCSDPGMMAMTGPEILEAFDDKIRFPRLAFVGQPGAGGMGLNLTASSVEVYYSNTFKFEDRGQSEDRIHRPGADHNRGCTIIDLIHLPQDEAVLDNLQKKRVLQAMTMGQLFTSTTYADERTT